MKVTFRTYCMGCRYGKRWSRPRRCLWSRHRFDWEYFISCDGRRLVTRHGFRSYDRAWRSAQRSWFKLAAVSCITTTAAPAA